MKNIGMGVQPSMEQYFERRIRRNTGMIAWYTITMGRRSDTDTAKNLATDIPRFGGGDAVFVMDRGFCSGWNLRFMIRTASGPRVSRGQLHPRDR